MKNIKIFGAGYVGLSLAVVLARKHKVEIFDIVPEKVDAINKGTTPISDKGIEDYLIHVTSSGNLVASLFKSENTLNADIIILALPTNFDPESNQFDTRQLDDTLLSIASTGYSGTIIIKSTIPVGYTDKTVEKFGFGNCFYSPEFLREGQAVHDNLHPSRIIVGGSDTAAVEFAEILLNVSHERSVPIIYTENKTAEFIKLASNTYLAMRIAFFNEIDSFAMYKNLKSEDVITGICADQRIGEGYNNPSFAYGGYCLPKDVRQLQGTVEENNLLLPLLSSIHGSNEVRLNFIVSEIEKCGAKTIGIYRLQMKQGSDNSREAANYRILEKLAKNKDLTIKLYEPILQVPTEYKSLKVNDLQEFIEKSDLIIANRGATELHSCRDKLFTRDIYNEN